MTNLKCPFCGKADIEYGLLLCTGCDAQIEYDIKERNSMEPEAEAKWAKLKGDMEAYDGDPVKSPFGFLRGMWALKQADKLLPEQERRANEKANMRIERGGVSIATFYRGDRSADVAVPMATASTAKKLQVVLFSKGPSEAKTAYAISSKLKMKMTELHRLLNALPAVLMEDALPSDAKELKAALEKAGAIVEIRELDV